MCGRCAAPSGAAFSLGVNAVEFFEASVSLMVRTLVVSARWAGRKRRLCLEQASATAQAGRIAELEARVVVLEDAVAFRDARLEVLERLRLLWLIDYYQIPKRS